MSRRLAPRSAARSTTDPKSYAWLRCASQFCLHTTCSRSHTSASRHSARPLRRGRAGEQRRAGGQGWPGEGVPPLCASGPPRPALRRSHATPPAARLQIHSGQHQALQAARLPQQLHVASTEHLGYGAAHVPHLRAAARARGAEVRRAGTAQDRRDGRRLGRRSATVAPPVAPPTSTMPHSCGSAALEPPGLPTACCCCSSCCRFWRSSRSSAISAALRLKGDETTHWCRARKGMPWPTGSLSCTPPLNPATWPTLRPPPCPPTCGTAPGSGARHRSSWPPCETRAPMPAA